MAAYGTEPMSSAGSMTERPKSGVGTLQPWREMFNLQSSSLPANFGDTSWRIQTNTTYFRMNYVIIVLLIQFIFPLQHPFSPIVFVIVTVAWLFLYFLRYEPAVIFDRTIGDWTVMVVLPVQMIVLLLLTRATTSVLGSLAIGGAFVLIHAALRNTDNLYADEESGSLLTGAGGPSSS